ncbi:unnamed protein product [Parajaminaea phylloscopi]
MAIDTDDSTELWMPVPPTPLELQSFLQRHLTLLAHERAAELEESRLLLSGTSPRVLERNGLALTRLGVLSESVGMGGKRLVELHRPTAYHNEAKFPPNSFRSGDVVALLDEAADEASTGTKSKGNVSGKGKKGAADPIDAVVAKMTDTKVVVAVSASRPNGEASEAGTTFPQRIRLVKVANEVTWERMEKNLVRIATKLGVPVRSSRGIRGTHPSTDVESDGDGASDEDDGPSAVAREGKVSNVVPQNATLPQPPETLHDVPRLLAVLLAMASPSVLPKSLDAPPLPLFNPSLNESQRQALTRALASSEVHIIHGPPGTGKTTLLVELALQLAVGRGERILVTGSSNLAVDNLGIRLVLSAGDKSNKLSSAIKCCRIGHPARVLPALGSHTLDQLSSNSSSGQLLSDVRNELQSAYAALHGPSGSHSAGNKSTSRRGTSSISNKRLTGSDRRKAWEEVRELRRELRQRERSLFTNTLEEANVVLTTLHGAGGGVLERALYRRKSSATGEETSLKRRFDTIIIDEACQAIEASSWGAIIDKFDEERGARLILAGDNQQLGPVVKSEKLSRERQNGAVKTQQKSGKGIKAKGGRKTGETQLSLHTPPARKMSNDRDTEEGMDSVSIEDSEGAVGAAEADLEALSLSSEAEPSKNRQTHLRPPKELTLTLFDRLLRLYGPAVKSLLTVQYRMNETIMDFPNREMYQGKLVAHESCRDRCLADGSVSGWKEVDVEPPPSEDLVGGTVVFYDTAGAELYEAVEPEDRPDQNASSNPLHSDSKSNIHEVDLVQQHVAKLLERGLPASAITLLAPYSAQVSALAAAFPASDFPGIEVGTIDALQGREQEVVIISLVRSNEEGEVGFLSDEKRLNVAMTRAKRQLVVIGDSETIRHGGGYLSRWMDWLDAHAVVEPILP